MAQGRLLHVLALDPRETPRIGVDRFEDRGRVGRIEGQPDDGVLPVELLAEFVGSGRLADQHRPCCDALVEARRDLLLPCEDLGLVHARAVRHVVAAPLEQVRQQEAMLARVVHAEGHLLSAVSARAHRVVVIEDASFARPLEQRRVRHRGSPSDVADVDHSRRRIGMGSEAEHVGGERQIGARSADDPGDFLDRLGGADKDVIELRKQFDEVVRNIVRPDLADEAGRHAAPLAPAGRHREREQLVGIVEDREEQLVVASQPGPDPRHHRPRQPSRARRQPR